MDVILIRHTSVNVPKGTCYGWSDVPVADIAVLAVVFAVQLFAGAIGGRRNSGLSCKMCIRDRLFGVPDLGSRAHVQLGHQ